MNERIRQFAKEAGAYFGDASVDYFGEPHLAFVNTGNIDLEKFAELIVGECTRKIEDIAESSNNPQLIYRVAVEVLEHFGVEE